MRRADRMGRREPAASDARVVACARERTMAGRCGMRWALAATAALMLMGVSCSHEKEPEPEVTVQVIRVQKSRLDHTVSAEAVLFPLQQSGLVPKISAPVKAFYVKRGGRVRKGQLLATLENRDLTAAAAESKGAYEQAQAAYTTTTVRR